MNYKDTLRTMVWMVTGMFMLSMTTATLFSAESPLNPGSYGRYGHIDDPAKVYEGEDRVAGTAGRVGHLQSLAELTGKDIKNHKGQTLGEIHEVLVDDRRDVVYYVVISTEEALYPVPASAFNHSDKRCTLDISPSKLEEAPHVYSLNPDTLSRSAFRGDIKEFYAEHISQVRDKDMAKKAVDWLKATIGADEKPQLIQCSEIIGLDARNRRQQSLGDVEDIIVDIRKGHLTYALVSYGGVWGIGEHTAVVPWRILSVKAEDGIARLDATEETLEAVTIDEDNYRQLIQSQFASRIHNQFDVKPYWEVFGYVPPEEVKLTVWSAGSDYNKHFDPDIMTTVKGTIISVGTFRPQEGAAPGKRLKVKTGKGESFTVYAGPKQFHAYKKDAILKSGQDITVSGSLANVNGKSVLIAREIQCDGKTLKLRTRQGKPQWSRAMLEHEKQEHMKKAEKHMKDKEGHKHKEKHEHMQEKEHREHMEETY